MDGGGIQQLSESHSHPERKRKSCAACRFSFPVPQQLAFFAKLFLWAMPKKKRKTGRT
jgi:hypothetical protein